MLSLLAFRGAFYPMKYFWFQFDTHTYEDRRQSVAKLRSEDTLTTRASPASPSISRWKRESRKCMRKDQIPNRYMLFIHHSLPQTTPHKALPLQSRMPSPFAIHPLQSNSARETQSLLACLIPKRKGRRAFATEIHVR